MSSESWGHAMPILGRPVPAHAGSVSASSPWSSPEARGLTFTEAMINKVKQVCLNHFPYFSRVHLAESILKRILRKQMPSRQTRGTCSVSPLVREWQVSECYFASSASKTKLSRLREKNPCYRNSPLAWQEASVEGKGDETGIKHPPGITPHYEASAGSEGMFPGDTVLTHCIERLRKQAAAL